MAIRKSVRALNQKQRQNLIDAIWQLKNERSSPGAVSTYDRYVVLHSQAMMHRTPWAGDLEDTIIGRFFQDRNQEIPPDQRRFLTVRNSAHRGPSFLPWHREYIGRFERDLQRISGNPDLGLPYWDWEVDGELTADQQRDVNERAVWKIVGGDGNPDFANMVTDGPFSFNPDRLEDTNIFTDPGAWITVDGMGRRIGFLQRALGKAEVPQRDANGDIVFESSGQRVMVNAKLPNKASFDAVLAIETYDSPTWDDRSPESNSFRNVMEGWLRGPALHNLVHVWVGGSMGPSTSPNDPVFFFHHCNVDRMWALWQSVQKNSKYLPQGEGPTGHNLEDPMFPWDGTATPDVVRPTDVLALGDVKYDEAPPL